MASKIQPLDDRVVLRRIKAQDTSAGGVIIPETAKERPKMGIVVAKGPGKLLNDGLRAAIDLEIGDKVLFGAYSTTDVNFDPLKESDLVLISAPDILAKVLD